MENAGTCPRHRGVVTLQNADDQDRIPCAGETLTAAKLIRKSREDKSGGLRDVRSDR